MGSQRPQRRPWSRGIVAAALTTGLVALFTAPLSSPAHAGEDEPLKDSAQVEQAVDDLLAPAAPQEKKERAAVAAPAPSQDDDLPGYETPDPAPPDHGSAEALEATIGGNPVASVGATRSEIRDDHSSSADATLLALGGQEVIGAHADSDGTQQQSAGDPLAPICEGSDGALCVTVLYAEAAADEGATTSHSEARSGVLSACVGGDDPTGDTCSGPVGAGVLTSWSEIDRDGTGHTEAGSGSEAAGVCVAPDPVLGTCTVSAEALSSEGSSSSRGTATKDTNVVGLAVQGQGGDFTEPTEIAIPPGCTSPSVACVYLNQGELYLADGVAGHGALALHVSALDRTIIAEAAQSETLVHQAGARNGPGGPQEGPGGPGKGPGDGGDVRGDRGDDGPLSDVLPSTGGVWSGSLAIGLLAVAAGGLLVAWTRRRDLDAAVVPTA